MSAWAFSRVKQSLSQRAGMSTVTPSQASSGSAAPTGVFVVGAAAGAAAATFYASKPAKSVEKQLEQRNSVRAP